MCKTLKERSGLYPKMLAKVLKCQVQEMILGNDCFNFRFRDLSIKD